MSNFYNATLWYFPRFSPTCFALRNTQEILKHGRNCSQGTYSYLTFPLVESFTRGKSELFCMVFDSKGIKWKLKISSLKWCQNIIKTVVFTTIKMATKKASLHVYVLRSIYNIVSVCASDCRVWMQSVHAIENL